jgi:two-component system response regulator FlrC
MRSISASEKVSAGNPVLMSWLRGTGLGIVRGDCTDARAHEVFVVAEGEGLPAPQRSLVLGTGAAHVSTARDGQPARLSFGAEDAVFGHAFAAELLRAPGAPAAADPASLALYALAERVAVSDVTVLINGPTGTGKEVLARHIHNHSARRSGPFIAVNCAALPEAMLEALLFGHQKGSFTGATGSAQGFFRAANGGTLLLDEIAEMPVGLQAKLLRVLQEREVVPLGATEAEPIDVRVIACANRDLPAEVEEGRFRADLYYRLSVFPLETQALNLRRQDIAALTAAMVLRHADPRRTIPWPTMGALDMLQQHGWPGNVRELENVIQRALLMAPGDRIEPQHIIFDAGRRTAAPVPVAQTLETAPPIRQLGDETLDKIVRLHEFAAIRETLAQCNGNRIETARRLGVSERTLRYRLAAIREAEAQGDRLPEVRSA